MADIESALIEVARQQVHELNAADKLEIRCRVVRTLDAKKRHRQRIIPPEYR